LYAYIRDEDILLSNELADTTLASLDHLRNLLDDFDCQNPQNRVNQQKLLEHIITISASFGVTNTPEQTEKKKDIVSEPQHSIASYYIMLQPDESFIFRGINLVNIFCELSALGQFQIVKHQFASFPGVENCDDNAWGIYLVTSASIMDIEDVFLFIDDNIKIIKLNDLNIFDSEQLIQSELNDEHTDRLFESTQIVDEDTIITDFFANDEDKKTVEPTAYTKSVVANLNITADANNDNKFVATRIAVDADKLDKLIFLVSELVTTNEQLGIANKSRNQAHLDNAVEKIGKLAKLFRDNALSLRLIPIDDLVVRFQRLIRDLSHSLNKEILFLTEGTDTELDKSIIDILAEPLMHIIRNSIDHGIETPENRVACGKQREGVIKLKAFYSGNNVYIRISDDGTGIDTDKIRAKAIEMGIIASDAKLNQKEIYDLIFLPGFSTAESLTQVSGRGVGMDVVRKKIADVRGDVFLESKVGVGTTFTIKLQQTVSIIDSLLLKAKDTHFLIPLSEIEKCDQQNHDDIFFNQNKLILFEQSMIPFIHLRTTFHIEGNCPGIEKIVIINKNDVRIAIVADRIVGEHQAVLKPLSKLLKKQDFLMGASLLGDGNMALMLDTAKLTEIVFN